MSKSIKQLFLVMVFCLIGIQGAGAGEWLRGDLHSHSLHSDGDSSVEVVLESAKKRELDFFALTDHDGNMHKEMVKAGDGEKLGHPSHWADVDKYGDGLINIYGIEWTTGKGHANVFKHTKFDYTELWDAHVAEDGAWAAEAAKAQDAHFSINHPTAIFCCPWELDVAAEVDTIEVWNAMYRLPNMNGWATHFFWDWFLLNGRRIPGIGGSDTHEVVGFQSELFSHGNPTTWVYVEQPNAKSIIEAMQAGRVSLSYAPNSLRLDFSAKTEDGQEAMMGDNLADAKGKRLDFTIRLDDSRAKQKLKKGWTREIDEETVMQLESGQINIKDLLKWFYSRDYYLVGVFRNSMLHRVWMVKGGEQAIHFSDVAESDMHTYYRAEVMGKPDVFALWLIMHGRLLAMSNPIYVGYD